MDIARVYAFRLRRCCCCCSSSEQRLSVPDEPIDTPSDGSPAKQFQTPSCLDVAQGHLPAGHIQAARAVLGVVSVLIPLPIFWALFFQTYSTWVFQAEFMNRGVGGYVIPQDMTQLLGPLADVLLILLFNQFVYPLMARCGRPMTPLQRIGVGIFFTVASFVVSGGLQMLVDAYVLPALLREFVSVGSLFMS